MSEYISREAAKDNVSQFLSTHAFVILPEIRKSFDKIPSADVRENIHGEWIREDIHSSWKCSRCNTYAIEDFEHCEIRSPFCPNCGAYMKGET